MELEHRFTVPAGLEQTWAHFNDIEGVAGCFPGATVTEADAESFAGTVKVKLGPIALVYNGAGTFVEKDEAAHRLVIDAKGKDKRGNGTAGALVTAVMSDAGNGSTEVGTLKRCCRSIGIRRRLLPTRPAGSGPWPGDVGSRRRR